MKLALQHILLPLREFVLEVNVVLESAAVAGQASGLNNAITGAVGCSAQPVDCSAVGERA